MIRFAHVDPQGTLLESIETGTRDDVAADYALAMNTMDEVDWSLVNHAILERWSMAALKYIKERAWKLRA